MIYISTGHQKGKGITKNGIEEGEAVIAIRDQLKKIMPAKDSNIAIIKQSVSANVFSVVFGWSVKFAAFTFVFFNCIRLFSVKD